MAFLEPIRNGDQSEHSYSSLEKNFMFVQEMSLFHWNFQDIIRDIVIHVYDIIIHWEIIQHAEKNIHFDMHDSDWKMSLCYKGCSGCCALESLQSSGTVHSTVTEAI